MTSLLDEQVLCAAHADLLRLIMWLTPAQTIEQVLLLLFLQRLRRKCTLFLADEMN